VFLITISLPVTHSFHGRQNLLRGGDKEVSLTRKDNERKKGKSAFGG